MPCFRRKYGSAIASSLAAISFLFTRRRSRAPLPPLTYGAPLSSRVARLEPLECPRCSRRAKAGEYLRSPALRRSESRRERLAAAVLLGQHEALRPRRSLRRGSLLPALPAASEALLVRHSTGGSALAPETRGSAGATVRRPDSVSEFRIPGCAWRDQFASLGADFVGHEGVTSSTGNCSGCSPWLRQTRYCI